MSKSKVVGIVLKSMEYRENDRIVTMYSDKFGKIGVMARGAKKNNSKFFSSTNDFVYGEFILYKGKSMYVLEDAFCIEAFRQFTEDLTKLTYASYLCELIDISCLSGEENILLFKEFITAMYLLKLDIMEVETLARIFEIKLLYFQGFGIDELDNFSEGLKKIIKYILENPMKSLYKLRIQGIIKDELEKILNKNIKLNFIKVPKSLELLNYINKE